MTIDWSRFPNFREEEFKCSHTGACDMREDLLVILQSMRDQLKKPIFISSGFRSITHPVEVMKDKPGEHTLGMAVDIICHGQNALTIIEMAQARGVRRIGVHQKGRASNRFIHLGIADKFTNEYPVGIWTY